MKKSAPLWTVGVFFALVGDCASWNTYWRSRYEKKVLELYQSDMKRQSPPAGIAREVVDKLRVRSGELGPVSAFRVERIDSGLTGAPVGLTLRVTRRGQAYLESFYSQVPPDIDQVDFESAGSR